MKFSFDYNAPDIHSVDDEYVDCIVQANNAF